MIPRPNFPARQRVYFQQPPAVVAIRDDSTDDALYDIGISLAGLEGIVLSMERPENMATKRADALTEIRATRELTRSLQLRLRREFPPVAQPDMSRDPVVRCYPPVEGIAS